MNYLKACCSRLFCSSPINTLSIAFTTARFRFRCILKKFESVRKGRAENPTIPSMASSIIDQFRNVSLVESAGEDFVSALNCRLSARGGGYRGYATYSITAHAIKGFIGSVSFTDRTNNTYLVKLPAGETYPQKKLAKQAVAEVAFKLLEAGTRPPIFQSETEELSLQRLASLDDARIKDLSEITGHTFKDRALALRALRHSSAGALNNDALAFLGDASIGYILAQRVYRAFPDAGKGKLTFERGKMVENELFERLSNKIGMTELLEVGPGMDRSRVCGKMVADMFEAVIAVLDLEGGREAVLKFWDRCA